MKVAFTTLGCRTNQTDTAEMQALLEDDGFTIVASGSPADIYVVNTCTVTAKTDSESRRAAKKALAVNDQAMMVFTGCYAQMNPEEAAALPGMDIVLGNANKHEIATVIRKKLNSVHSEDEFGLPTLHMSDITSEWDFKPIPVPRHDGRTKAFIKVQTGCDETCTFCTVVHARGRSISDSRENILNNTKEAINAGFKEITLTGINLGTYGRDHTTPETFSSLVEEILNLSGNFRVRISSINPMEIDDHLIELMASRDNLCPHFHIPLQSGSDAILKGMRRNYDSIAYRRVVERAAKKVPQLGLGADIIVGFPGETENDFELTRQIVEDYPFSYLHVFPYSPRQNTDAFSLKDNIPSPVKKERNKLLTGLVKEKGQRFKESFLGKTVNVLVENNRDPRTGLLRGHSEHYVPVSFEGPDSLMNTLVPVSVQEVTDQRVLGCLPS